jgi:ribonuclease R
MASALTILNELAKKMRAERIANGALTIEQEEVRFKLDKNGFPTEIYFEQPSETHHLIEEFMLLANRTVAKAVGSGRPFVYRVHDLPDSEKLEAVKKFKREAIQTAKRRHRTISEETLNRTMDMLTIRAQAKAVYSTYNIGHYGLAFSHYTHFTSPIRRYPDLMVHRLVEKYILTGKPCSLTREELEEKCEHCSACEQEAAQAERDSIKQFQAMWMKEHEGEVLQGHITSIMDFGFFVQLDESRCEGLVHMMTIEHPEDYILGDEVKVLVVRVDLNKSQIDFELVENA